MQHVDFMATEMFARLSIQPTTTSALSNEQRLRHRVAALEEGDSVVLDACAIRLVPISIVTEASGKCKKKNLPANLSGFNSVFKPSKQMLLSFSH